MIELLNIDCMEYMKGMPDKSFDLAIVDPQYGIGISKMKFMGGNRNKNGHSVAIQKNGKKLPVKRNEYKPRNWDEKRPDSEYFKELFRVSKNQIIWGGNYFSDLLPVSSGWIFWDKEQSANYGDGELAWTSFPCSIIKIKVRWNGMIQYDMSNKEKRIHPTQKPILLYKKTINKFGKPGNKILDTHGGSMSIAIAAHEMGFSLVCCEKDTEIYDSAYKRFKEKTAQSSIDFD